MLVNKIKIANYLKHYVGNFSSYWSETLITKRSLEKVSVRQI